MRKQKHCLCYLVHTRGHISFANSTSDFSAFKLRLFYITIVDFMLYELFLGLTLLSREHDSITAVPGLLWYLKNIFIVIYIFAYSYSPIFEYQSKLELKI